MSTHEHLLAVYGPLLDYKQLSQLLKRSPAGVKADLGRAEANSALSVGLRHARLKIGRRVYYRTVEVAEFIDTGVAPKVRRL